MSVRETLKWIVSLICRFLILPLAAFVKIMEVFIQGDQPFQLGAQTVSLVPGFVGNYLRKEYYRLTLEKCSRDVCIEFGTILNQPTVELGPRVYIGTHCSIGECVIEEDAILGSNVDIISGRGQHKFDRFDVPVREQGGALEKVVIGADCWIGNSAVIMANVGEKSIVGAGSVVVQAVEPCSIVGGNPARLLRKRQSHDSF
jgi:virginiamycin A acetyltransferase